MASSSGSVYVKVIGRDTSDIHCSSLGPMCYVSKLEFMLTLSESALFCDSFVYRPSVDVLPLLETSCARGDTICLRPLQVDNIFVFIRQVAPVPACWLFKTSATS